MTTTTHPLRVLVDHGDGRAPAYRMDVAAHADIVGCAPTSRRGADGPVIAVLATIPDQPTGDTRPAHVVVADHHTEAVGWKPPPWAPCSAAASTRSPSTRPGRHPHRADRPQHLQSRHVDTNWLIHRLNSYVSAIDRYFALPADSYTDSVRRREDAMDTVHHLHHTAATIVSRVSRDQLSPGASLDTVLGNRITVLRVIGQLQSQDELEHRLGLDVPRLPFNAMHPWVWGAAQQFWETTHYREAVHAAAKSINSRVQLLTGRRDIADNDLMNQAFSVNEPTKGNARLRIPGDHSKGMVKGQQQALKDYAAGCFGVIRNPAAHDEGDWDEQYALERLAALSVLAGLIEATTVLRAEEKVASPGSTV